MENHPFIVDHFVRVTQWVPIYICKMEKFPLMSPLAGAHIDFNTMFPLGETPLD